MKNILEGLGIGVVCEVGCAINLVFMFVSAVVTLIVLGTLFNLIF